MCFVMNLMLFDNRTCKQTLLCGFSLQFILITMDFHLNWLFFLFLNCLSHLQALKILLCNMIPELDGNEMIFHPCDFAWMFPG